MAPPSEQLSNFLFNDFSYAVLRGYGEGSENALVCLTRKNIRNSCGSQIIYTYFPD
jgi:hypothetical protein